MTRRCKRGAGRSYPWLSVSRFRRGRLSLGRADWVSATVLIVLAAAGFVMLHQRKDAPQSFTAVGRGGDIRVSLVDVVSGEARFFEYLTNSGQQVRFFIVRSNDGVTRAAFDACQPCHRERGGYRQAGTHMVCNYCRKSFHSASIDGTSDECHPAPLERRVEGDALILRAAALERGASLFQ